jgi:hypothetical protein
MSGLSGTTFRTIAVPASTPQLAGFSVAPPLFWPMAEPYDDLDYTLDLTAALAAPQGSTGPDTILSVAVAAKPSGTGELSIGTVIAEDAGITIMLAGGVPGRTYQVETLVQTAEGRAMGWVVDLTIDPATATFPLPAPQSTNFGTPVAWSIGASFDFSNSANSFLLALI